MTTKTVSVKDAQAQFPELLDLVSMGNRVVIQKDEEPLAELVGIRFPKKGKRVAGLNRGKIRMSDDFDAPLPDEFLGRKCQVWIPCQARFGFFL